MEQLVLNENKNITIKEYINKYLDYIDVSDNTIKTYNVGLLQFIEYLKNNNIQEPTREDIIAFREYLKQDHQPNTINAYLIAIRNFYGWLAYEGKTKDITTKIKGIKLERKHLKRGLSLEEIRKVLNVCKDTREELIIKLMVTCALRINEVSNIQLQDFYDDKGVVMLKVLGKARDGLKQDSVKIDDRILELIKKYCKEYEPTDYLFYSTSNHNKGGKVTNKTLRLIVNELYKRANIEDTMVTVHSLRHSACEMLLESGNSVQEVSQFLRHKSLATVMVYAKELNQRKSTMANDLASMIIE